MKIYLIVKTNPETSEKEYWDFVNGQFGPFERNNCTRDEVEISMVYIAQQHRGAVLRSITDDEPDLVDLIGMLRERMQEYATWEESVQKRYRHVVYQRTGQFGKALFNKIDGTIAEVFATRL